MEGFPLLPQYILFFNKLGLVKLLSRLPSFVLQISVPKLPLFFPSNNCSFSFKRLYLGLAESHYNHPKTIPFDFSKYCLKLRQPSSRKQHQYKRQTYLALQPYVAPLVIDFHSIFELWLGHNNNPKIYS